MKNFIIYREDKIVYEGEQDDNNPRFKQLMPTDIIQIDKKYYDSLPNSNKDLFSIIAAETEILYPQNIKEWFKFWEWKKKKYFKKNIIRYHLMLKGDNK